MTRFTLQSITTLILLAVSSPAAMASRLCDELWFTRNWVMEQAGYCFRSTLAQAYFDNSDCSGHQVTLTPAQSDFVAEIQRREAQLGCSVDTGRSTLDMPSVEIRLRLEQQPLPYVGDNEEGWGCLGYDGARITLFAAPSTGSTPLGRIDTGAWISVGGHQAVNGWQFVTTYGQSWNTFRSGGWMQSGIALSCQAEAG